MSNPLTQESLHASLLAEWETTYYGKGLGEANRTFEVWLENELVAHRARIEALVRYAKAERVNASLQAALRVANKPYFRAEMARRLAESVPEVEAALAGLHEEDRAALQGKP